MEREDRVFLVQTEQPRGDFFKLQDKIGQQQLEARKDLINQGWDMLMRLSDPEYLATEEAQESDQDWTLRMLQMAPDPKQMKGGSMSDSEISAGGREADSSSTSSAHSTTVCKSSVQSHGRKDGLGSGI